MPVSAGYGGHLPSNAAHTTRGARLLLLLPRRCCCIWRVGWPRSCVCCCKQAAAALRARPAAILVTQPHAAHGCANAVGKGAVPLPAAGRCRELRMSPKDVYHSLSGIKTALRNQHSSLRVSKRTAVGIADRPAFTRRIPVPSSVCMASIVAIRLAHCRVHSLPHSEFRPWNQQASSQPEAKQACGKYVQIVRPCVVDRRSCRLPT
jgi:hypothetical protein